MRVIDPIRSCSGRRRGEHLLSGPAGWKPPPRSRTSGRDSGARTDHRLHRLEARGPFLGQDLVALAAACPPELKLAQGGKGVLKDVARPLLPDGVVDRPKGYFPVPGMRNLSGTLLDRVQDALTSWTAKERGLFEPGYIDALLADPDGRLPRTGGNRLWQGAVLELWLQEYGIGGTHGLG